MTAQATTDMVVYCFDVILAHLKHAPTPACPSSIPNRPYPIFVTWKTLPHMDLRGCIGSFAAQPLHEQLRNYAMAAAFEDTRFSKITLKEVASLACTVSLLHSFEVCKTWSDWIVGTHGIVISYGSHHGTYLPSVAEEQGWNHDQTIRSLFRKAGYYEDVSEEVLRDVKVNRYQVSTATLSYHELPHGHTG